MSKKKKSLSFPESDDKFDAAWKQLMAHLGIPDPTSSSPAVVSWTRLGMDNVSEYTPLVNLLGTPTAVNSWEYVYPLEKAKGTHTDALKLQKNTIKADALVIIHAVRLILKEKNKTTKGFLTANDMTFWYIPNPNPITPSMDAVRTSHPIPALSIHETKSRQHTVDAHNPETPKSTGLPEGMQFIWLKRFIGATPPADPDQYQHVMFSGKFRNVSTFLATYQKQTVWYIACYISSTGETGEFSDPLSANIA
jgi:hypothetical protein